MQASANMRMAGSEAIDQTPVGVITAVHGPVVVIACDVLPPLRQALCASLEHETCLFEVHQHLDEHHLRAITLHRSVGLRRGMPIYDTGLPGEKGSEPFIRSKPDTTA